MTAKTPEAARRAFQRQATREAVDRHADAPHGTRSARVRAEVSCRMSEYDVSVWRAARRAG